MKRQCVLGCLPIMILLLTISVTSAQSPPAEKGQTRAFHKSGCTKANETAIEILRRMSPEEISRLDQKIAKALVYYYDRNYASALPIFIEVA